MDRKHKSLRCLHGYKPTRTPMSLYNLALETFVEWGEFQELICKGLPANVKEDILNSAVIYGKANGHISTLLHQKIRNLCINDCEISDEDVMNISHCQEIRILKMNPGRSKKFDHSSLLLKQLFSSVPQLLKLHIQRNFGMTDDVVSTLTCHCKLLQELDISGCRELSDEAAVCLSTLPSLRILRFSDTKIGNVGLKALAEGACALKLTEIELNNCEMAGNDGFRSLVRNCKNLVIVVCNSCPNISHTMQMMFFSEENAPLHRLCCQRDLYDYGPCQHVGDSLLKLYSTVIVLNVCVVRSE